MDDFNINLLHAETSCCAYNFLLSLQSFSFIPTINKPMHVYNNSATLINNILTNKVDVKITSGNIISDISNHYSQFCFFILLSGIQNQEGKVSDIFLVSLKIRSTLISAMYFLIKSTMASHSMLTKLFPTFMTPLKTVSNQMCEQFSKPWITSGLKKSIKVKNFLLQSGNLVKYKFYRNRICTLTRLSKKNYFLAFFSDNFNNMKNTWNGINSLINNKRKNLKLYLR